MTKRLFVTLCFVLLSSAAVACSGDSATPAPAGVILTTPVANPTATPVPIVNSFEGRVVQFEVNLAINGSPQQGTAVFSRTPGGLANIEIKLKPGVAAQMVTIRRGQCPNPEGFEETLDLAIGGVLRQELREIGFDDLMKGNLTLVVSSDDDQFNSYAACADLPKAE